MWQHLETRKSIVIISITIISVIVATEHLMDYNDFGFKTPPYPEQLTIWKVELLSDSTAKLIVMNIGDGEEPYIMFKLME